MLIKSRVQINDMTSLDKNRTLLVPTSYFQSTVLRISANFSGIFSNLKSLWCPKLVQLNKFNQACINSNKNMWKSLGIFSNERVRTWHL